MIKGKRISQEHKKKITYKMHFVLNSNHKFTFNYVKTHYLS